MIEYFISFAGGVLSVVSPCVIPVLPAIFATSEGKWSSGFLIVTGMVFSFGILGFIFGFIGTFSYFKYISYVILAIFGLILLSDSFYSKFAHVSSNISSGSSMAILKMRGSSQKGIFKLISSFILGLSLGAVWSPCIGPLLGVILGLISLSANPFNGFFIMLSYGFGMASAISIFLMFGNKLAGERLVKKESTIRKFSGFLILFFLLTIITGIFDSLEIYLAEKMRFIEIIFQEFLLQF